MLRATYCVFLVLQALALSVNFFITNVCTPYGLILLCFPLIKTHDLFCFRYIHRNVLKGKILLRSIYLSDLDCYVLVMIYGICILKYTLKKIHLLMCLLILDGQIAIRTRRIKIIMLQKLNTYLSNLYCKIIIYLYMSRSQITMGYKLSLSNLLMRYYLLIQLANVPTFNGFFLSDSHQ